MTMPFEGVVQDGIIAVLTWWFYLEDVRPGSIADEGLLRLSLTRYRRRACKCNNYGIVCRRTANYLWMYCMLKLPCYEQKRKPAIDVALIVLENNLKSRVEQLHTGFAILQLCLTLLFCTTCKRLNPWLRKCLKGKWVTKLLRARKNLIDVTNPANVPRFHEVGTHWEHRLCGTQRLM